jgi:hypothetical protein
VDVQAVFLGAASELAKFENEFLLQLIC